MKCTLQKELTIVTHKGKKERATSADNSCCVSDDVQKYSVQYNGYNLIRVTTVDRGTMRGTTALVYYWIHSSLYTGTVQG
jgi:hypothetical protein